MNPARSEQETACLPSRWLTACAVAATSGAVEMVDTTSTSFITWAGLKKCIPPTSVGRPLALAHSITGRLDVVVASTAPGCAVSPRLANSASLTGSDSTTASMIMVPRHSEKQRGGDQEGAGDRHTVGSGEP